MRSLVRVYDRLNGVGAVLVAVLVLFMMVATIANIVFRMFGSGLLWAFELTEYCVFLIPFLGAAWLLKMDGHVKLDVLIERMNTRIKAVLNTVTSLLGGVTVLVLAWYSGLNALDAYEVGYATTGILTLPRFVFLLIIPIGCLALFLQFIRKAANYYLAAKASPTKPVKTVA